MVLVANAKLAQYRMLQESERWAKEHSNQASVALPNKGGRGELIMELINLTIATRLQPVIYKGGGPMMTDLLGGQAPRAGERIATFGEYIKSGQIMPIVVSGGKRLATPANASGRSGTSRCAAEPQAERDHPRARDRRSFRKGRCHDRGRLVEGRGRDDCSAFGDLQKGLQGRQHQDQPEASGPRRSCTAPQPYRPCQRGARFSTNALTPSTRSSLRYGFGPTSSRKAVWTGSSQPLSAMCL